MYDNALQLINAGKKYAITFDVYDNDGNKATLDDNDDNPSNARLYLHCLTSNYKTSDCFYNRGFCYELDKQEMIEKHGLAKDVYTAMELIKLYDIPLRSRNIINSKTLSILDFNVFRNITETLSIEGVSKMTFQLVEISSTQ